jgi:hypothetical protein
MFSDTLRLHPKPWYLGMHYGVDFVNYLNRCPAHALSDIIFDAEVFVTVVKESDTYCLVRKHSDKKSEPHKSRALRRASKSKVIQVILRRRAVRIALKDQGDRALQAHIYANLYEPLGWNDEGATD